MADFDAARAEFVSDIVCARISHAAKLLVDNVRPLPDSYLRGTPLPLSQNCKIFQTKQLRQSPFCKILIANDLQRKISEINDLAQLGELLAV
jgi:hypothetical protein